VETMKNKGFLFRKQWVIVKTSEWEKWKVFKKDYMKSEVIEILVRKSFESGRFIENVKSSMLEAKELVDNFTELENVTPVQKAEFEHEIQARFIELENYIEEFEELWKQEYL
jgi:hypothetical protein